MPVRALMILHRFPPDGSIAAHRAGRLLSGLARRGIETTVLCRDPGAPPDTLGGTIRIVPLGRSAPARARGGRASLGPGSAQQVPRFKPIKRFLRSWLLPDAELPWIRRYLRTARSLGDRFDLVVSSSSPYSAHLAAREICGERALPWVLELRDQWADNPYLPHRRNPVTRRIQERWERACLSSAVRIVVTNEAHAAQLAARRPDLASRIDAVPTGFEVGPATGSAAGAEGAPRPRPPDPLRIVHAGSLYGGRDLSALGRIAQELSRTGEGSFRLVLAGSSHDHPWERVGGGADVIELHGRLSPEETLRLVAGCHLGVVHNPAFDRVHVPGKLFDYLGLGVPVLDLTRHPDVPRYCEGLVPCWKADPDRPESLAQALREVRAWWREEGRLVPPSPQHPLSAAACSDRFADVLLRAVERR